VTAVGGRLPKRTRERLTACEAVGLSYWADHPVIGHVWAVDSRQQAHVVRTGRTPEHVCCPDGVDATKPPPAA
jgi:hypothetical protein